MRKTIDAPPGWRVISGGTRIALLLASLAGLTGCGGSDAPLALPTSTPTFTSTSTPTLTNTPTASSTSTWTPTSTSTPSRSATLTSTPTSTPSPTASASSTRTVTPSATSTYTPTVTTTRTATRTPTVTRTPTAVVSRCGTPGIICTVAGTGKSQFDGDGRPATQTSLYFPYQVLFDPEGRPLIIDWNNLRLRRINPDGRIETIMGNDIEAFPEEGARAEDTSLHHTSDARFDRFGRLYLAGHHIPILFRVGTDDRVHTICGTEEVGYSGDGGPALEARLGIPFGVWPLDDGSFYFTDSENNVIRFVDAQGIIQTVAGNGEMGYSGDEGPATQGRLNKPRYMQRLRDGTLYFCDTDNHAIRKIDPEGILHTIAGNGTPGYDGDGGPAVAAHLDSPSDLRIGPNGDLYIADSGNNVIRRIDKNGVISTVVGTGDADFRGDNGDARFSALRFPVGIAFGPDGALWIVDTFNHRVRRIEGFLGLYP